MVHCAKNGLCPISPAAVGLPKKTNTTTHSLVLGSHPTAPADPQAPATILPPRPLKLSEPPESLTYGGRSVDFRSGKEFPGWLVCLLLWLEEELRLWESKGGQRDESDSREDQHHRSKALL